MSDSRGRTPTSIAKRILKDARYNARKQQVPFDLVLEDILSRIERGVCEASGLPLQFTAGDPLAPSLDRIVPHLGYTKSNVEVVCWAYNQAKNRYREGVFSAVANAYVRRNDNGQ